MAGENVEFSCTPPEIREAALEAVEKLLPAKSKAVYDTKYSLFNSWCSENGVINVTENVLLAYFERLSKKNKSSTLWSTYSMLRACLNVYKNTDISRFARLQAFLKRQSQGYQPKKSKILEAPDIDRFLREANDLDHLAKKASLFSQN